MPFNMVAYGWLTLYFPANKYSYQVHERRPSHSRPVPSHGFPEPQRMFLSSKLLRKLGFIAHTIRKNLNDCLSLFILNITHGGVTDSILLTYWMFICFLCVTRCCLGLLGSGDCANRFGQHLVGTIYFLVWLIDAMCS